MKVYLLVNEENKYKIGFSNRDINKRIKELQVGSSSEIRVVHEYESTNARQIETVLHRIYKSNRISGEWFNLSDEKIFDFKRRCEKIDEGLRITQNYKK